MIQSWNKFCFTGETVDNLSARARTTDPVLPGGRIEVSVSLPGTSTISGLWPSVWLMGNLGRAGSVPLVRTTATSLTLRL